MYDPQDDYVTEQEKLQKGVLFAPPSINVLFSAKFKRKELKKFMIDRGAKENVEYPVIGSLEQKLLVIVGGNILEVYPKSLEVVKILNDDLQELLENERSIIKDEEAEKRAERNFTSY